MKAKGGQHSIFFKKEKTKNKKKKKRKRRRNFRVQIHFSFHHIRRTMTVINSTSYPLSIGPHFFFLFLAARPDGSTDLLNFTEQFETR